MACKRSSVRSRLAPPLSQKQKPPMGVQLSWESICFASRGSTVRSRIPPPYFKALTGLFFYIFMLYLVTSNKSLSYLHSTNSHILYLQSQATYSLQAAAATCKHSQLQNFCLKIHTSMSVKMIEQTTLIQQLIPLYRAFLYCFGKS